VLARLAKDALRIRLVADKPQHVILRPVVHP
jgi:hypothetical protein